MKQQNPNPNPNSGFTFEQKVILINLFLVLVVVVVVFLAVWKPAQTPPQIIVVTATTTRPTLPTAQITETPSMIFLNESAPEVTIVVEQPVYDLEKNPEILATVCAALPPERQGGLNCR